MTCLRGSPGTGAKPVKFDRHIRPKTFLAVKVFYIGEIKQRQALLAGLFDNTVFTH